MCIFKDCIWPKTRSGKLGRTVEEVLRHIHPGRGEAPHVCWAHAAYVSSSLPGHRQHFLRTPTFPLLRGPVDSGAAARRGGHHDHHRSLLALSGQVPAPTGSRASSIPLIKCVFMCHRRSPCVNQLNHRFAVFQPQIANSHQQTGASLPSALGCVEIEPLVKQEPQMFPETQAAPGADGVRGHEAGGRISLGKCCPRGPEVKA